MLNGDGERGTRVAVGGVGGEGSDDGGGHGDSVVLPVVLMEWTELREACEARGRGREMRRRRERRELLRRRELLVQVAETFTRLSDMCLLP
jgi:hypothetical protein